MKAAKQRDRQEPVLRAEVLSFHSILRHRLTRLLRLGE
jgi:hypothetical protein